MSWWRFCFWQCIYYLFHYQNMLTKWCFLALRRWSSCEVLRFLRHFSSPSAFQGAATKFGGFATFFTPKNLESVIYANVGCSAPPRSKSQHLQAAKRTLTNGDKILVLPPQICLSHPHLCNKSCLNSSIMAPCICSLFSDNVAGLCYLRDSHGTCRNLWVMPSSAQERIRG